MVKMLKCVKLEFAFKDVLGERVEVGCEVMVSEYKEFGERVLLGCNFLRECGARIERQEGGDSGWLVLGQRRVRLESVREVGGRERISY
jgi:hypothetical protein